MVPSEKKSASAAVGAKSARACDNCIRTRARWYCAADDAFLCQSCDSSVHSANPLARWHERVCLNTVSLKQISVPTWHRGFTRRARTPRQKKPVNKLDSDEQQQQHDRGQLFNSFHLVPYFGSEDNSQEEENKDQLLYRVPIFYPFVSELCTSPHSNEAPLESRPVPNEFTNHEKKRLEGFLPSEMDLAEFTADVESLLGKGLEDKSFSIKGLGILDNDHHHEEEEKALKENERVKVEEENGANAAADHEGDTEFVNLGRDTFELNFYYDDSAIGDEGEENKMEMPLRSNFDDSKERNDSGKMFLRLDYERVASAWDDKRCPWTNGERPDLASDECWRPDCMGECGTVSFYGDIAMMSGRSTAMKDGGREARVSRFREKRRTRLFSKKIRYEVRKLNAERRPRMKGRFVKRSNVVAPPFTLSNK